VKKNIRARTPAEIPKLAVISQTDEVSLADPTLPSLFPFSFRLTQDHLEQRLPELLVPPEVGHTHHGVEPAKGLDRILRRARKEGRTRDQSVSSRGRDEQMRTDLSEASGPLDDVLSFGLDLARCGVDGGGHAEV
jgi:hypothetical protein